MSVGCDEVSDIRSYLCRKQGLFLGLSSGANIISALKILRRYPEGANIVPFTIIPISYFVYKEKIPPGFFWGIAITLVGLVLLINGKASPSASSFKGDFLAFSISIFYALFLSVVYKLRTRVSAIDIMFYSAFGSIFVLLPAAYVIEGFQTPTSVADWWPLITLALFSQIFGRRGYRETSLLGGCAASRWLHRYALSLHIMQ
ncbi:DMT family transporter [Lonsdalea populi]|uniref:DMT family transporter n=1 Tax=Lonsdalea populi TaxID=1172565 RepID=UPI0015EB81CC|nr:hypothetical protein [Lonsdalea populi]